MPAQPQWLLRLPEIIAELERLDTPVVDRAVFEKLFGVGRRRAIQLMHQFAGHQVGRTFIIDRLHLVHWLKDKSGSDTFHREQLRRHKIVEELEQMRKLAPARNVMIHVLPNVRDNRLSDLPVGIHLSPGELRIEFFGTEDLLSHLFELSQAIVNDYAKFERICERLDG